MGSERPVVGTADVARIEAPVTVKAYLICAFAAFGGIFFGYDIGWMSGVLGMPYFVSLYTGIKYDYNTQSPHSSAADFALSSYEKSLMTGIMSLGTFVGALVAGDMADFIGRRTTIILGCGVFAVGCILQVASSDQLALFVMGRFVAGMGVGFESAVIVLYMSEIAPRKIRGALVAGYQFCITIGLLLASCVVYATQDRRDSGSYRIPIAIQFLWAIILGVGLFLLPESPRFYVKMNKLDKAGVALSRIRGQPIGSNYIRDELAEIIANFEYERQMIPKTTYIGSWTTLFQGSIRNANSNLRRTILAAGMQMTQQLAGQNFIFYFGITFFQQLGTINNPFLTSLITTLVNVCCTPPAFWTIEKFGRRFLLVWGGIGMLIMQFLVGIIGTTSLNNRAAVQAMIACICINIAIFASTWGPAAWVVVGETFPLPIRSRGVGVGTASCWFWNCIVATVTPYLVGTDKGSANLGPRVFFIWGSLCCANTAFAYFLVPEMKGLSLEQIDKMLEEVSPRRSAGWKPHVTFAAEMGHVDKAGVTQMEQDKVATVEQTNV